MPAGDVVPPNAVIPGDATPGTWLSKLTPTNPRMIKAGNGLTAIPASALARKGVVLLPMPDMVLAPL